MITFKNALFSLLIFLLPLFGFGQEVELDTGRVYVLADTVLAKQFLEQVENLVKHR